MLDDKKEKLLELVSELLEKVKNGNNKIVNDLVIVQNRLFTQLESLSWLQRQLAIEGKLPPLRGWATSPDVLLHLHTHITQTKPKMIVEFGSGASTLVIADALGQNGHGKLISIEHSQHYGNQTLATLQAERLEGWVDLRIGELEAWVGEHLNPSDAEKPSKWYPLALLKGIEEVDLIWVDGPPGATCLYSRYPALPALVDTLLPHTEVWMDDTVRQEEKDICDRWAKDNDFEVEYYPLEKGLGRLKRPGFEQPARAPTTSKANKIDHHPEHAIGLDFSLPKDRN